MKRRRLLVPSGKTRSANKIYTNYGDIPPLGTPRARYSTRARRPIPVKQFTPMGPLIGKSFKGIAKEIAMNEAAKVASAVGNAVADKLVTGINGISLNKPLSDYTTNRDAPVEPAVGMNSLRTMSMANSTEPRVIHSTQYITGTRPSRVTRELAKTEGTGYRVLCDSKIQFKKTDERDSLTHMAGFNSRNFHVPCDFAQMTIGKVLDTIKYPDDEEGDSSAGDRSTTSISALLNVKQQYMIHNTSSYFPMKFKIHLVKLARRQCTYITEWGNMLSNGSILTSEEFQGLGTVTDPVTPGTYGEFATAVAEYSHKAPWWTTHTGVDIASTEDDIHGYSYSWNMSLKGKGLAESEFFKNNFKVVETFEKTIPPGDFWNFSHTHQCGSGVNFDDIFQDTGYGLDDTVRSYPFTVGVVFEVKGTLCEGLNVTGPGTRDTYLGTSPAPYTYEFKSSAYYVRNRDRFADSVQVNPQAERVYRRQFTTNPTPLQGGELFNSREIFGLPDRIREVNTGLGAGDWYIPVMSGSAIRTTTRTAGDAG